MHPISELSTLGVPSLTHLPCMQITLWDVALTGRFGPSGSLIGGAYCHVPTPHARVLRESGLSLLETGDVVWKPPFFVHIYYLGCRGPRLPHPSCAASYCAAPSTVTPTRGYEEETLPWPAMLPRRPIMLTLVNARGWLMPEAGQHPRTVRYNYKQKKKNQSK